MPLNIPQIIILNGPSSAGKSSISKALQAQISTPYLHFQMDAFWDMAPKTVEANSENFPKLKVAMIESIQSLAKHGHCLILDIVFMPDQMQSLYKLIFDYSTFSVAVTAPLYTLNAREKTRGDRKIGLSESQHAKIHIDTQYDLTLNTDDLAPEHAVDLILTALKGK